MLKLSYKLFWYTRVALCMSPSLWAREQPTQPASPAAVSQWWITESGWVALDVAKTWCGGCTTGCEGCTKLLLEWLSFSECTFDRYGMYWRDWWCWPCLAGTADLISAGWSSLAEQCGSCSGTAQIMELSCSCKSQASFSCWSCHTRVGVSSCGFVTREDFCTCLWLCWPAIKSELVLLSFLFSSFLGLVFEIMSPGQSPINICFCLYT